MSSIAIREAVAGDVDDIVAVVNTAYRPEPGLEGWTHEATLVSGSRIDSAQVRQALEKSIILVAANGLQIVGCVQIQVKGQESHIGMLAVLPSAQAVGLGKLLLANAEHYAQSNLDARLFVLLVVAERRALIDFYVRRGYKESGDFRAYPLEAGVGTPFNRDTRLAVLHKCANL